MSFASGLFSFMGGASTQFREELDLAAQAKAAKAKADALAIKEEQERLLEAEKFKITTGLTQQEIDIKAKTEERLGLTEKRKGAEFKLTHGLDVKYFKAYEYLSKCCKANYRQINTIDRHNKEEVKIYCIDYKKWCELIKSEGL